MLTTGIHPTQGHPLMGVPGSRMVTIAIECCAAAPGSTIRGFVVLRFAAGMRPAAATTLSVFGLCLFLREDFCSPLLFCSFALLPFTLLYFSLLPREARSIFFLIFKRLVSSKLSLTSVFSPSETLMVGSGSFNGSWNNNPGFCRSAFRNRNTPGNRNNVIGFRVVSVLA